MKEKDHLSPEEFIEESLKMQNIMETLARKLTGQQVPEFSSEPMTVKDASELTGIAETSIRAGIIYGWLPIGVAVNNGKEVHSPVSGRVNFLIYPRKVWEVTGHIWRGKEDKSCTT